MLSIYLLMPFTHRISNLFHSVSHTILSFSDSNSIETHTHSHSHNYKHAHLHSKEKEHKIKHEHQLINFFNSFLESTKNKTQDKEIISLKYQKHFISHYFKLVWFFQYKTNSCFLDYHPKLKTGFFTIISPPPKL